MSGQTRMLILAVVSNLSLTALLSHSDHGIVANKTGYEGQRTGPQVLYHRRHECPSQGLFKSSSGRCVLRFVAMRDDDIGNPLLSETNGEESHIINLMNKY